MSCFTTSEINLYFTYDSAKRTLSLKDINDFISFWHCVKQPYCIPTLSNSWHERFCFALYLWEGRNKIYKATKSRKILMTTVPPGGLFEYTRRPIFVSASVHIRWSFVSRFGSSWARLYLTRVYGHISASVGKRNLRNICELIASFHKS
jgi:hypothetical protein